PLALGHVARVHEEEHHFLQELEIPRRVGAEKGAQRLQVDRLEVAGEELFLEALETLHLPHELDGLAVRERLRPLEEIAVAAVEVLEVADVLELIEQVGERAAGVLVREVVVAQALEGLGDPCRELVEQLAGPGGVVAATLLERVALEVEELLELLAQLGER